MRYIHINRATYINRTLYINKTTHRSWITDIDTILTVLFVYLVFSDSLEIYLKLKDYQSMFSPKKQKNCCVKKIEMSHKTNFMFNMCTNFNFFNLALNFFCLILNYVQIPLQYLLEHDHKLDQLIRIMIQSIWRKHRNLFKLHKVFLYISIYLSVYINKKKPVRMLCMLCMYVMYATLNSSYTERDMNF